MEKRQKSTHMSPVMIGDCNTSLGKPKFKPIKILFDSGTTSTIIAHDYAKKLRISKIANNSASCSSENAVALYEEIHDDMILHKSLYHT